MQPRILITGIGGGVGMAVLTASKKFLKSENIFTSDITELAAGLYLSNRHFITEQFENSKGLAQLLNIIDQHKIDMVIPGNEYDLLTLSNKKDFIQNECDTHVAVSQYETIFLTCDKLETYKLLAKHNIRIPKTYLFEEKYLNNDLPGELRYPFVAKPRFGNGSKGFMVIRSKSDLPLIPYKSSEYLIQELLVEKSDPLGSEFTCSVFNDFNNHKLTPFSLKRTLKSGVTWVARHEPYDYLNDYLLEIANVISYQGPLNVQLIDTENGPVILEINCRFSGSTGIRSGFGFNEVELYILSFLLGESIANPKTVYGTSIRYLQEIFI